MKYLLLMLLVGCDSCPRCVQGHTVPDTCVSYLYFYDGKGNITASIPQYYDCERYVCDVYERPVEK